MRTVNEAALDLIKRFEGFSPKAYVCPGGRLTIGYGHTKDVSPGDTITRTQADLLLRQDVSLAAEAVEKHVTVPLNDNQFGALVSFVFNLGAGAFKESTLLRLLNDGQYEAVPVQLNRWVYSSKQRLRGLVLRRAAEGRLWETPVHQDDPYA